ncbi:MAG TPA: GWxTD domain-containing protein [Gemmatimonadales bacterium]|nr:GWxTD domain-containing protein [Gemmatimonadales bacterium]
MKPGRYRPARLGSFTSRVVRLVSSLFILSFRSSLLPAQIPDQEIAFRQFRELVATVSDTVELRALLRASRSYDEENQHDLWAILRSGLVALRLGELRADPDHGEAISIFRNAARRTPDQPEPWFFLGLAEEGRSEWEMSVRLNLGNRVGLKALERAVAHHQRALHAHPGYTPAALALARLTLALRDTARLARAVPSLERAAAGVSASPELLLAWGRVARAAGNPQAALEAFERYVSLGENRALGLLELSRTALALGHPAGEKAYFEGASLGGVEVASEYVADIAPFLGDSAISELETLSGEQLAEGLRRFWTDRDRVELRAEGERLREHYRRLQYARLHFPLTISRRFHGRLDAYRSGNVELDDRGIIYIRHGEPAVRLRPFVFGAMPNESWRYARAEGDLLLHFSGGWDHNGGGDLYDYRLVQSVLDLRGAADAPQDQLLLSRQSLSPAYSRMLNWGRYGAGHARALERSIGTTSIAVGTTTDTHELGFHRRLQVVADLIAVGRSTTGSLAHLVFGIAAAGLSPDVSNGAAMYPVRVRLVALDQRDRPLTSLDTTLIIRHSRPLGDSEFLVGRVELTLPRGEWRYRASLQQGDSAGVVLPRQSVVVADMYGSALALSDIALGSRGRAVSWITDAADTVLLAPSGLFRKGANVELYYEVGGATPRQLYRHEITVLQLNTRAAKRRSPLVALSFHEAAADSVIRSQRVVRLDRLKEGSYLVEVKITAPDGSSRIRQRSLRLIK